MSLNEKQKRELRRMAHSKKPVVIIGGNGLSENVVNEIHGALEHHELLKVRVNAMDREERDAIIAEMTGRLNAELVQRIGHIAIIYRAAETPKIRL